MLATACGACAQIELAVQLGEDLQPVRAAVALDLTLRDVQVSCWLKCGGGPAACQSRSGGPRPDAEGCAGELLVEVWGRTCSLSEPQWGSST